MKAWLRRHRLLALLVLIIVLALVANSLYERLPEVEVASARVSDLTLPLAASGLVEARASDLGFKGTGRIVELYREEGDRVRQWEVLARLVPGPSLSGLGGSSADTTGDTIQAPYDGSVVVIYRRAGAVVQPGEPVMRVVADGPPWVTVFVESEDAVHLRAGQQLSCRAGGYLSEPQPITITEIGSEAISRPDLPASSRQVRVRCDPVAPGFSLPPGTEVDVDGEIPLLERGLLIPANAVSRDGATDTVWIVQPGNTVTRRQVRIGPNNFDLIAITEGLQEEDRVVVLGKENLQEGQRVRVRPVPPAEGE